MQYFPAETKCFSASPSCECDLLAGARKNSVMEELELP